VHLVGFTKRMKFQVCRMNAVISMCHSLLKQDNWREMQHIRMKCKQAGGEYFTVIIALCELLFGRNTYKCLVFYTGCFYFCLTDKHRPSAPLDDLPTLRLSPRVREVLQSMTGTR